VGGGALAVELLEAVVELVVVELTELVELAELVDPPPHPARSPENRPATTDVVTARIVERRENALRRRRGGRAGTDLSVPAPPPAVIGRRVAFPKPAGGVDRTFRLRQVGYRGLETEVVHTPAV
jgi:hypothetical protein